MTTDSETLPFSIENFVKLFEQSESRKYLPAEGIKQIEKAIAEKDLLLLESLYKTLLAEKAADDAIVAKFLEKKQKLMDKAVIQSQQIYSDYVVKPQQQMRAVVEAEEHNSAEGILDNIPKN